MKTVGPLLELTSMAGDASGRRISATMRASSGSFSTTHRPAHEFIRARPIQACSALALTLACVALFSPAEAGETGSDAPSTLTGDWGARTRLLTMGVDVDLTYTGEVFGNL